MAVSYSFMHCLYLRQASLLSLSTEMIFLLIKLVGSKHGYLNRINMQLQQSVKHVFIHISESLHQLSYEQYKQRSKTLFNATIGQHVRHIIELFVCLETGYESGLVNYEKRKRDVALETNKDFAQSL